MSENKKGFFVGRDKTEVITPEREITAIDTLQGRIKYNVSKGAKEYVQNPNNDRRFLADNVTDDIKNRQNPISGAINGKFVSVARNQMEVLNTSTNIEKCPNFPRNCNGLKESTTITIVIPETEDSYHGDDFVVEHVERLIKNRNIPLKGWKNETVNGTWDINYSDVSNFYTDVLADNIDYYDLDNIKVTYKPFKSTVIPCVFTPDNLERYNKLFTDVAICFIDLRQYSRKLKLDIDLTSSPKKDPYLKLTDGLTPDNSTGTKSTKGQIIADTIDDLKGLFEAVNEIVILDEETNKVIEDAVWEIVPDRTIEIDDEEKVALDFPNNILCLTHTGAVSDICYNKSYFINIKLSSPTKPYTSGNIVRIPVVVEEDNRLLAPSLVYPTENIFKFEVNNDKTNTKLGEWDKLVNFTTSELENLPAYDELDITDSEGTSIKGTITIDNSELVIEPSIVFNEGSKKGFVYIKVTSSNAEYSELTVKCPVEIVDNRKKNEEVKYKINNIDKITATITNDWRSAGAKGSAWKGLVTTNTLKPSETKNIVNIGNTVTLTDNWNVTVFEVGKTLAYCGHALKDNNFLDCEMVGELQIDEEAAEGEGSKTGKVVITFVLNNGFTKYETEVSVVITDSRS